ncbi:MAG: hypothetical protein OXC46_07770 [Thaumarchaeota archaeon]|nr:hypothetical protein [Nitrososphaerota archaeon]
MPRMSVLTVFMAVLIVAGSASVAWGAQLDARVNPNNDSSPFSINYQKTVFIEYPNGGQLFDLLRSKSWTVSGVADSSSPEVQALIENINLKILNDGSHAKISDLDVKYEFQLHGRQPSTSIDYKVELDGTITDYVITKDSQRTLVDLGWRGISATGDVIIDGVELNMPLSIIEAQEPELYNVLQGTAAEEILRMNLINADFVLEQPMTNWHFLFDPTGINVDAGTFGLDDSISGYVVSSWTMGESSIREGIQIEKIFEADIVADQTYTVRSVQSSDAANLYAIGFGALDVLDGLEIVGVTPTPPEGYTTTSTGDFPVFIIYGMAGMAVIGGVAFFIYSNRALKNEKQGQQGISPDRLVGYKTSESSGGYHTNRGEAQLRDESDYNQTRSVYEGTTQQTPPPTSTVASPQEDAACGCAASVEMGSECDCAMQGSCLCDATCRCGAELCEEQANSMR